MLGQQMEGREIRQVKSFMKNQRGLDAAIRVRNSSLPRFGNLFRQLANSPPAFNYCLRTGK
jgi:hypothetical protein